MKRVWWLGAVALMVLVGQCMGAEKAPLPARLLAAKTAYLDGQTYARVTDAAYDELSKWKRFTLVNDPKTADVIFRVTADGVAENSTLSVIDPSSGTAIWSVTRDWGHFRSSGRELVKDLRKRMEH